MLVVVIVPKNNNKNEKEDGFNTNEEYTEGTEYISYGQFIALRMYMFVIITQFFCLLLKLNSHCPITLCFVSYRSTTEDECRLSLVVLSFTSVLSAFPLCCYTTSHNQMIRRGFFPSSYIISLFYGTQGAF